MKNWCKIIQLENNDILIQRLSTDEDGEHIEFKFKIDGVTASFKASYEDDVELADETFEKYSKEDAQKMLNSTLEMFKS